MSSDRLNVRVVSNQNSVELTKNENTVVISDKNRDTSINVLQKETAVVTVASKGPKGDKGDKGDTGIAVTNQIATGSITASVDIGTDTFRVQRGSSTFFNINSSGSVGIGVANPTLGLLQVGTITNPHANVYISAGNTGTSSLTVRAINGFSGHQRTYNPVGGSDSLNFIQLLDGDTTSATDQPIGRIIFSSNDTDSGGTNTTKAFIEAVAEDATPNTFLAFGTAQANTSVTERMRITSVGNVGIGTTSPTNTLQVNGGITSTYLTASYIDINTTAGITQPIEGRLSWDNTDGTLDIGLKGGNITLQVGQKQVVRVVNRTGDNLLKSDYKVVRIRRKDEGGAQGQRLAIKLSQANNDPNSVDTLGLVAEDINNNQEGYIITSGLVYNINTTGTLQNETWDDGDVLYLSPTVAGALTNIKPIAPNHTIIVGFVVHAHNQGKIFVKVDNGYEIDELHNVRINTSSLAVGDLLIYSSSVWTNSKQMTGSYVLNGNVTVTGTASINTLVVNQTQLSTGSNQLGDNIDDTQTLYGSVIIPTGSLTVTGSLTTTGDITTQNLTVANITASENIRIGRTKSIGGNNFGTYNPILTYWNDGVAGAVQSASFGFRGSAYMDSIAYPNILGFGTNDLRFFASTNGIATPSEIIRIVGSTGFVGIGETSPSAKLEIRGSGATSATTALRVENSNTSASLVVLDNGNVGIGTTSPTATLEVSGSTIITGSFNINAGTTTPHIRGAALRVSELANGAAGTLTLGSVSNIYSDLGAFSFRGGITGTTEFMYLSGSRVGIGTNNPTNTLQVVGGITATLITASIISASSGITGSLFGTSSWAINALTASFVNTASTNAFVQGGNSFGATALLGTNDTQNLQFETSGSVRMTISSSGNVGIGTSTPSTTLQVAGTSSLQNIIFDTHNTYDIGTISTRVRNIWSNGSIVGVGGTFNNLTTYFTASIGGGASGFTPSANLHVSGASNSNLLRVGSPTNDNILFVSGSGNVGIGTTTPTRALYVSSSAWDNTLGAGVIIENSNTVGSGLTLKPSNSVVTNGSNGWAIYAGGPGAAINDGNLGFWAHGTNEARLVIQRAGNVGIGTTTPQRRLHIDAFGSANTDIPLLLTSVDANNRVGIRFASSSLSAGRQHSLFNRVSTPTAEWLLGTNAGETAQWNFIPRDDTNYAITLRTPFNGGTAQITTGLSQSLFSLGAGGTGNQHLNISSSGNVGIGTTTPTQRLDVRGNTIIAGTTPLNPVGGTLEVYNNASNAVLVIHEDSGSAEGRLWFRTEGSDTIFRNLNTRFSIDAETKSDALTLSLGGRVGIGTSTSVPSSLLQVRGEGATSATTAFRVENSNATASLVVLDDGNVGIGTTSPSAQLHISGSATIPLRVQNPATTLMQISSSATNSGSIVFFGTTPTSGLDLEIQSNGAANGGQVRIAGNGTQWDFGSVSAVVRNGTGNPEMFGATMTGTSTTLVQNPFRVQFNANQSSTGGGGYTVLRVNATHATTAGTGSKLLQTWEFGGVQRSVVNITGSIGVGITTPSASVHISSSLGLPPMLTITPHDPLPTTNIPTGTFMVSASVPPRPYMWDGTSWYAL